MRPRLAPLFRGFGWALGVLGAGLAVVGAATLGGGVVEAGATVLGLALIAGALIAWFAAAMLAGFAQNLELLTEIRDALRRRQSDQGGS